MNVLLGSGFPARDTFGQDEPPEPQVSVEDLRAEQILAALDSLRDALVGMPPPQVHVEAPDLSRIVMAVQGLKPGSDADDIAKAVVRELGGSQQQDASGVLQELVEAMKDLDFRMKGIARGGGGGSSGGDVTDRAGRQLGVVTVSNGATFSVERTLTERMFAKAPATGYSLWLDTADLSYIYIAESPEGSAAGDATFRGIRVQKDVTGNPLGEVQQASAFSWTARSAAGWT